MTISEVSKKYDLTVATLRYYESVGLIPDVKRNSNGRRIYDESSCGWIEFIKCMREAGITIESLVEYVKLFQQGSITTNDRKNILIQEREILHNRIKELTNTLEKLDWKIANYDSFNKE